MTCPTVREKETNGKGRKQPKLAKIFIFVLFSIPISISGVVFLYYECWYYYLSHVVYFNAHMKMR